MVMNKKQMAALREYVAKPREIKNAELVVALVAQHCKNDTLPNDALKAEFNRLRKAGYIITDEHGFYVNYEAGKQENNNND